VTAADLSDSDAERLRAFEREGHDALATSYQDFFASITALATEPLLDAVRAGPGIRFLDVAAGPGGLAAAAATRGALTVGVDLSPRMVELARRLYPKAEFYESDVEHLPFADRAFDAIVCGFGLGHFPRPEIALAECVRVLNPGGRIALSWWDHPDRQRVQGIFRDAITEVGLSMPSEVPRGHNVYRFSDTAEFLRLLHGAGLDEVGVAEHTTVYSVADTETLWRGGLGSLVLTGAAIRQQDKAVQDRVRAAFERRAGIYKSAKGLDVPVAFKVGVGHKPT
jgi:SAM-dependent methyltransferase